MVQRLQRIAQQEAEEAKREVQKTSRELGSTSDYLAGLMSELAVSGHC